MDKSFVVAVLALIVGLVTLLVNYASAPKDRVKEGLSTVILVLWKVYLFAGPPAVIIYYYIREPFDKPV